jgi:hypothetical protein
LLSASWIVRKNNVLSEEQLMQYGYTREESQLVIEAVYDNCCTHEDFIKILKAIGVTEQYSAVDSAS